MDNAAETRAETQAEPDEPGWDVDPDDEQGAAIIAMVGQQIKMRRIQLGLRARELGDAIGYSENLVHKVEAGQRIPRPGFLDGADRVLRAGGLISATKGRVAEVRYPKRVRDLARMEAKAVEVCVYANNSVHGLLQTEGHARALLEARQPAYGRDEVERGVAARMARRSIYEREPAPNLSFVQEEAALRRPVGGRMEWRRQLEHLAHLAQLRSVSVQVMPTRCETHPGLGGWIEVLKFADGSAVGRSDGAFNGRPVTEPKQLQILELRYGMIRAQALAPAESLAFIEQVLGDT